jgi:tRNA A-37 threonylcarbamoyl transferase component Bud32
MMAEARMTDQPAPDPAARPTPVEGAARLFEEAAAETGARPPPPSPADLAPSFPELEILSVLGQGGMGVVYKARHRRLDRLVALKVLPRELAQDPQFADRFAREARTLARLDHPHVVRVHDFGRAGEHFFLLLEFVDGANLRQVMGAGRLTPAEALAIVPQICDALQYAHDQGVVHRDIKPENVLLDARGRVKLADFGLAKLVDRPAGTTGITATGQVMGTFQYMAPEQVKAPQDVDHRADIYSLGVVFYEMLTGELPMGRFEPPSQAAGLDDARIDRIVLRTLERERSRRYQQADEIRTDVAGLASLPATSAPGKAAASPSTSAWLWTALVALPVGWLLFAFVHAAWGPVERGTDDATARETWKGLAAALVFVAGGLAAVVAAVRGASVPPPRRAHKLGATLALLHVAGLLVLIVAVSTEVARHSNRMEWSRATRATFPHGTPEGGYPGPSGAPAVDRDALAETRAALQRIVARLKSEGATPDVIEREYLPTGHPYESELADYAARGDRGMGPFLLRMTEAERERLEVLRVDEEALGRRRVIATLDGRYTWRFPMHRHEGRWVLVVGRVDHEVGVR